MMLSCFNVVTSATSLNNDIILASNSMIETMVEEKSCSVTYCAKGVGYDADTVVQQRQGDERVWQRRHAIVFAPGHFDCFLKMKRDTVAR